MGSFANTVFTMMLGWVRSTVAGLWSLFSSADGGKLLAWLGEHWKELALILCVLGTVTDGVIHLIRWRPLAVWASFFRRLRGHGQEEAAEEELAAQEYERRQAVSAPAEPETRITRQWVYADGKKSEMPQDWPEEQLGTPYVPKTRESYLEQYAQPVQQVAEMLLTVEKPAMKAVPGLEGYPQPRNVQEETVREEAVQETEAPAMMQPETTRRRRALRRMAELPKAFLMREDDEDELQLRYRPAKPPVDKTQAYHEPVYPPAWKLPVDTTRKMQE